LDRSATGEKKPMMHRSTTHQINTKRVYHKVNYTEDIQRDYFVYSDNQLKLFE